MNYINLFVLELEFERISISHQNQFKRKLTLLTVYVRGSRSVYYIFRLRSIRQTQFEKVERTLNCLTLESKKKMRNHVTQNTTLDF